jgi:hypothetical protein
MAAAASTNHPRLANAMAGYKVTTYTYQILSQAKITQLRDKNYANISETNVG